MTKPKKATMRTTNASRLPPPKYLGSDAKVVWRRVAAYLARCGRLEGIDGFAIETLALAVTRQRQLHAELQKTGMMDAKGRPHPLLRQIEMAANTVKNVTCALGLTPGTRRHLPTKPVRSNPSNERGG